MTSKLLPDGYAVVGVDSPEARTFAIRPDADIEQIVSELNAILEADCHTGRLTVAPIDERDRPGGHPPV
ncbi:hypothetical protein ABT160_02440 [Streptomyces sp. NPDC001941]|uniref:hypothetical protein n=1 Tax=Streptomyces sp. NPDC001941 TaxID=3154659 RepID=UPI0033183A19